MLQILALINKRFCLETPDFTTHQNEQTKVISLIFSMRILLIIVLEPGENMNLLGLVSSVNKN